MNQKPKSASVIEAEILALTMPGKNYRWNTNRVAEVVLDEYKRFYYRYTKNADPNFGNVTERSEFKIRNNCKPFKWFLENVYNIPVSDDIKDP
ncbi:CLUMA_CG004213, isoform A [Clunio marinus]|uniref:CLUMA_CG004213, isoform A n=1 Tax=Clunio marinus TaxID=568069 RepID=A0A1J1HQU3_9DIPT|nr:CLUMA_CG004213, isoform A [Clunio marinus]